MSEEQNKSEDASPYKLQQARKKGMVARSAELGMFIGMACCTAYLWLWGDAMALRLAQLCQRAFAASGAIGGGGHGLLVWSGSLASQAFGIVSPLAGLIALAAVAASVAQTGLLFAPAAIKPDLSRLNPAQSLKRIFSAQMLLEAAKACVKMAAYAAIAWWVVRREVASLAHTDLTAAALAATLRAASLRMLTALLAAALVFAAIDQILARRMFARKMRMSHHELKQEFRQREGDPRIKQRRKQLQRELLKRSQSMRGIRHADVVLTNPTHLAVGLRYDPSRMSAPMLVAKGSGDFALRLRKLAFVYGVPVVEAKSLARHIFRATLLDQEIPGHLYRETASVYLRIRRGRKAVAA
jgi:flagellar biosynthetic protein FlhB